MSEIEKLQEAIEFHRGKIKELLKSAKETKEFKNEYNERLQKKLNKNPKCYENDTQENIKYELESKIMMDILISEIKL